MIPSFKKKFIQYLSQGIPLHIDEDEVHLFYKSLSDFVNKADNDFESYYTLQDDCVLISDRFVDYLKIQYSDDLIIFRTTKHTKNQHLLDPEEVKNLGRVFLGVVLFIESIVPSNDINLIPQEYHDQWYK